MTVIPWEAGRPVIWAVTVACVSADSYVEASAREAGIAAELASTCKTAKYTNMSSQFVFHPIAVETQSLLNESARDLLRDVGRHTAMCSGDECESSFSFQ